MKQRLDPDIKDGFQIREIPKRYQKSALSLRDELTQLTPLESVIYCAAKVNGLRRVARALKRSHEYVRQVYKNACRKLKNKP